ncbi:SPOR domain-containing protein [Rhodopseudomonas palustris]|uniref:Sporulation related n=1 Tax=Rhodopseudomonas palustris (strain BisB18) TaxID=316056 RepID=Q214X6_RHOPB
MAERYQDRPFPADDDYRNGQNAAAKADGDPLAELARLIGQTDPFANFGRANQPAPPAPSEPARDPLREQFRLPSQSPEVEDDAPMAPLPSWMQNRAGRDTGFRQEPSSSPHPAQRYATPQPAAEPDYRDQQLYAAATAAQPADPERYDDALYGAIEPTQGYLHPQQDGYSDQPYDYADSYADDGGEVLKPRRSGMMTVVAVLTLAVVGTGAAFGYRTYVGSPRSGEPPVIRAEAGPIKVVPPSGDAASKPIQDRLAAGNAVETLISREEQPQDPSKAAPRVVLPPLAPNGNPPSPASVAPGGKQLSASSTGALGEEPRKIKTLSVRPDQADPSAAPYGRPAAKPAAPAPAAARTPPAPVANANASTANAPLSLSPQSQPAEPRARVASTQPTAQPATSGGYVVQVSSQRSEADAQASFRALQSKFGSVLGSHRPLIKRADLGEKGVYYRAMVGPFGSPDEASQFCGNLKSAGGQCVVQRN